MAEDLIPNQIIALVSIIVSTLCIYGSNISVIGGILAMLASVLSTVFGTNTLRHIGEHSLGTGIPSIVYMLSAVGLVSYISALLLSLHYDIPLIFPILSIIFAVIIAAITSWICKYVFDIKVEILTKSFVSIAVASMLLMISLSTLIAQTYYPAVIYETVIENGIILLLLIISVMGIQNPYNSCLGPNEDQYRTLSLSCANAFLMLIVISIVSILNTEYWMVYLLISLICWFVFFRQYIVYTRHQAASIKTHGLWPTHDGDD